MTRLRTILAMSLLACGLAAAIPARAAAQAPVVCYDPPVVTYAAPPAAPQYFVGSRYSLYTPSYTTTNYYAPAYVAPSYSATTNYSPGYVTPVYATPRYYNPGPYYYTPTYSYTPGYYSYYYTPGYFRY